MDADTVQYSVGLSLLLDDPTDERPGGQYRDEILFNIVDEIATLDDYWIREVLSAELPMACGSDDDVGDLVVEARYPDVMGPLKPAVAAPILDELRALGDSGTVAGDAAATFSANRGVILPPWCPQVGVFSFQRPQHPLNGVGWMNMVHVASLLAAVDDADHLKQLLAWCTKNQFPVAWRRSVREPRTDLTQEQALARLDALGVDRWDTSPPAEGVIRFLNGRDVVAQGRYMVILSFGPGREYTMAWAISAYERMGIPYVSRASAGGEAHVTEVETADAWRCALDVGKAIGCDFVYRCSTLWVAVFDFQA